MTHDDERRARSGRANRVSVLMNEPAPTELAAYDLVGDLYGALRSWRQLIFPSVFLIYLFQNLPVPDRLRCHPAHGRGGHRCRHGGARGVLRVLRPGHGCRTRWPA